MQLILWRHADAEMSAPDQARRLTALGVEQARRMAAWIKSRVPADLRILVSPALRACETADALHMDYSVCADLYSQTECASMLELIDWPDSASNFLLVGHQPTLGQWAAFIMTGQAHGWEIEKAGLWWFDSGDLPGRVTVKAVQSPFVL